METNTPQTTIERVLEKIHNNELTQKPKTYFRLRFAALIIVILAIFVVSIFFSSFILFSIQAGGQASLLQFGPSGWDVFLLLFPWKLLILEVLLLIGLEWLLRDFKFGYKIPVLYLFGGVVLLMVLAAFALDTTPFHTRLLEQADEHHLPGGIGDLYETTRLPPQGQRIFRGQITSIVGNTMMVDLDNPAGLGTTTPIKVIFPIGHPLNDEKVGDRVFIEGVIASGTIQAHAIHNADDIPPPPQPHQY